MSFPEIQYAVDYGYSLRLTVKENKIFTNIRINFPNGNMYCLENKQQQSAINTVEEYVKQEGLENTCWKLYDQEENHITNVELDAMVVNNKNIDIYVRVIEF